MMPVRRPRVAFALLVACALPVAAGAQSPAAPPVARLVANLQAHYDRIADFSADFEHHYAGGVLRTTDVERGTMHVKKPRRWRFDYVDPEPKLFVCDGTTIHSWFPADRQVIVSPLPAGAGASTSAALLAGEGDLLRDFTARYAAGPPPEGAWSIELRPVAGDAGYESLILTVDRTTLDILEIATTDFQGGVSTYVLSNVMQNQGLSDTLFGFDVPADVEVIR
ncbi:MAG: outer membrane lipoprotein carrier protein LolA [Acidobacteria bacterium]|nr:outer membrane lipoprotein carrier protein LolA [Acidobacteriota bacterium]